MANDQVLCVEQKRQMSGRVTMIQYNHVISFIELCVLLCPGILLDQERGGAGANAIHSHRYIMTVMDDNNK